MTQRSVNPPHHNISAAEDEHDMKSVLHLHDHGYDACLGTSEEQACIDLTGVIQAHRCFGKGSMT